jgi:hypothetical protein
VAYVRTVKTASGATAVQVVWSSRRGSRNIEHVGSAHDDAELEALKAAARQRLAAGQRDSIEAHLTIVFAALAVTRFIETRTGWSIRKFPRTARRYRTVQIRAGQHILTAEDPLPPDLRDALALTK